MESAGPLPAQHLLHSVQHTAVGLLPVVRTQGTGVEMAEINTGHQPLVQRTQLQHLVQIPQLVDLSHGLGTEGDVTEASLIASFHHRLQRGDGNVHGLTAGALHQGAGMDNHPPRSHPVRRQTGGGDVADGLVQTLRVGIGQIDEIRRVEGQADTRLGGVVPQLPGGLLPHVDTLAALVLIALQPLGRDPSGGGQRGLMDFGKAVAVSRGAEPGAHMKGLRLPSQRKGVSTA